MLVCLGLAVLQVLWVLVGWIVALPCWQGSRVYGDAKQISHLCIYSAWFILRAQVGVQHLLQCGSFCGPAYTCRSSIGLKLEQLQTVSAAASKEQSMLVSLQKMEAEWADLAFKVSPYKDTGEAMTSFGTEPILLRAYRCKNVYRQAQ